MKLLAIDPPGCGCTECVTGEYVPLNRATPEQVADMLLGRLRNNTGRTLRVEVGYMIPDGGYLGDADYAEHGTEVTVTLGDIGEREQYLRWTIPFDRLREAL